MLVREVGIVSGWQCGGGIGEFSPFISVYQAWFGSHSDVEWLFHFSCTCRSLAVSMISTSFYSISWPSDCSIAVKTVGIKCSLLKDNVWLVYQESNYIKLPTESSFTKNFLAVYSPMDKRYAWWLKSLLVRAMRNCTPNSARDLGVKLSPYTCSHSSCPDWQRTVIHPSTIMVCVAWH